MASISDWISSFRLRTLPLALSCIVGGSVCASIAGNMNWTIFGLAALTTILLQVLSNIANDYGDGIKGTDNENRLGPTRAIQSKAITPLAMKKALLINSLLAFFSGVALIMYSLSDASATEIWSFVGLGVFCIIAAISYTVGKNAYGYSGLGDLFVFIFFGLVGVLGTYYLHTKQFDLSPILIAVFTGGMSAAVLNMNNMRDIDNDRNSGKNTLVVKMGSEKAKIYHITLLVISYLSLIAFIALLSPFKLIYLLPLATMPIFFLNALTTLKNKSPQQLDGELKKIALGTFATILLLGVSLLF
ncbi:MAG: 1,4-dihydroxy-2-naphthoate octaprenyltransferase [Parvicella sp.]|jgi:1,4-dihydroxy-2-naphthoate octaprenyltransferase